MKELHYLHQESRENKLDFIQEWCQYEYTIFNVDYTELAVQVPV